MSQPSDTPETEAKAFLVHGNIGSGYLVAASFARELERQRDAAREDARRLAKLLRDFVRNYEFGERADQDMNKALAAHEALTAKP